MARVADIRSRETLRLAAELEAAIPAIGRLGIALPLAVGLRELLTHSAFQATNPVLGDALDVELAAGWGGKRGVFVELAAAAGMIAKEPDGKFSLPSYEDALPSWGRKREQAKAKREALGKTISELRAEAGKKGGSARASKRQANGGGLSPDAKQTDALPSFLPTFPPSALPPDQPAEQPPASSPPPGRRPSPASLLKAWNGVRGTLPEAKGISSGRERAARARLNEVPDLERWEAAFRRAAASPFCLGENERGWRATFDWFLQPDTLLKVEEGKYDPKASPKANEERRRMDDVERKRKRDLELQNQAREEARRIRAGLPMREEATPDWDSPPSAVLPSNEPTDAGVAGWYAAAWTERYGEEPAPRQHDIVAAEQALKPFPAEEQKEIIRAFVADDDPWLCDKAHRLGLLPGQLDRIRAKRNGTLSSGRLSFPGRAAPRPPSETGFAPPSEVGNYYANTPVVKGL